MGHLYHSYVANYHGGLSSQTETETEGVYTRSKWEFNSMVLVVLEKQKANTWTIQQQSSKCRYIRYGMVDFRPTNETQRYHWSRTPQSSPYLQALRENGSSHFSTKKWQYIKTSGFSHGIFVFFSSFWLFSVPKSPGFLVVHQHPIQGTSSRTSRAPARAAAMLGTPKPAPSLGNRFKTLKGRGLTNQNEPLASVGGVLGA